MGVPKLLYHMKPFMKSITLNVLEGKALAVDASIYLYLAMIPYAKEYICRDECLNIVNLFTENMNRIKKQTGAKSLIVVFDGAVYSGKKETVEKRNASAKIAHDKVMAAYRQNEPIKDAFLNSALRVSCALRMAAIKEIKSCDGIEYMVAPYEADAQLAHLQNNDHVYAIITSDSDLMLRCRRVIYDLKVLSNTALLYDFDTCFDMIIDDPHLKTAHPLMVNLLSKYGIEGLLNVSIFAGCDYWPCGIQLIGIQKATKFLFQNNIDKNANLHKIIELMTPKISDDERADIVCRANHAFKCYVDQPYFDYESGELMGKYGLDESMILCIREHTHEACINGSFCMKCKCAHLQ